MPSRPSNPSIPIHGWAFGLALVVAMLAILPGLDQPGRAPREAFLPSAALGLLALAAWRPRTRPPLALILPVGLALVAGLAGIVVAPRPERLAVARDLAVTTAPWLVAVAAAMVPRAGLDRGVERGAVLSLAVVSALGLLQSWTGWEGIPQAYPPAATFANKNLAAQALLLLVPLALPPLWLARSSAGRWLSALGAGAGVAFLVATRTRGAWLAAVPGLGLGVAAGWGRAAVLAARRRWLVPGVLALALAACGLVAPLHPSMHLGGVGETVQSLARPMLGTGAIRLALWRNTLALIGESPWLGAGPGRFEVAYPAWNHARVPTPRFGPDRVPEHAENDALEFAAELGLPAALGLVALVALAVLLSLREARRAATPEVASRAAARAAALAAVALYSLVAFPLHSPGAAFVTWLLVGRSLAPAQVRLAGRRAVRAVLLACAILLPFAAWVGVRELRAQAAIAAASQAALDQRCSAAEVAARRAMALVPWRRRENGMGAMIVFQCNPDPARSLGALEPALSMQPDQINLLLAVGARRHKAGRLEESEATWQRAVEITPDLGRAWLGLALVRYARGDEHGTTEACAQALRLDPDYEPVQRFCR